MDLDPQTAETIVTSLKDIISHEINLFDTTGTIIASTDLSRIGTSHDGARLTIATKKTVFIDSDNEFKGARHGINMPVLFNDSVVAVIGITGERSEVEPFGKVIKKMTEILIRENWEQISRFDQRERRADLVNMLTLKHCDISYVNYLSSVLEINLTLPHRAITGRLAMQENTTLPGGSLYELIYTRFQPFKNSFFSTSSQEVSLFIDEQEERDVIPLLHGIESDVHEHLGQLITFGIGSKTTSVDTYYQSYREAQRTADWLAFSQTDTIGLFEDMDYGIFLSSIPHEEACQLTHRVFGALSDDEIEEIQKEFNAYTRNNGSITHAAQDLFLHKNTMQNRLNRIAKKTGYNPRILSDYAVLSIAFQLREYERFREGTSRKDPSSSDKHIES